MEFQEKRFAEELLEEILAKRADPANHALTNMVVGIVTAAIAKYHREHYRSEGNR